MIICTNNIDNTVTIECNKCGKESEIKEITPIMLVQWRSGKLIQDVMPHLTTDERELLISGTCGKCYDAMFKD